MIGEMREAAEVPKAIPVAGSCPACAATNPGPVGGTCRVCGSPLRLVSITLPGAGANSDLTDLDPPPVVEGIVSFAKKTFTDALHPRVGGGHGGGEFRSSGRSAPSAPRRPRGDAPYSPTGARASAQRETHGASGVDADARRRVTAARALHEPPAQTLHFELPTAQQTKLSRMFDPEKNAPKLRQPTEDGDELFDEAGKAMSSFQEVLDMGQGVSKALGGKVSTSADVAGDQDSFHVIVAPLKSRDRSDEKVATKYGGDYSRLGDVMRATIVAPRVQDVPQAVDALRKEAAKRGWKLHAPENRFAFEEGSSVNTGPLPSGYMDSAVQLVSPSGVVAEVQINTAAMVAAKKGGGHKLYEQERSIIGRAQLAGRPMTPEELSQVEGLRQQAQTLYTQAFHDSFKQKRRGRAPERADAAAGATAAGAVAPKAAPARRAAAGAVPRPAVSFRGAR